MPNESIGACHPTVGLAKFSRQKRPEESADAITEINGADGRGAITRKIARGKREHRRGQHRHADALRQQAHQHGPESGHGGGKRGSSGKNDYAREQHHLPRIAGEQVARRQASESEAKSKNSCEETCVGERESEGLANVGGEHRKQVSVRSHQNVGDEQNAIHRDGDGARARLAFPSVGLSHGNMVLNCLVLPCLAENGSVAAYIFSSGQCYWCLDD